MTFYDCFNGDADGICALTQLRLAEPRQATLVTGVKRDINLLQRVHASQGDQITVLDVSLDKNRSALQAALDAGAEVFYCDHHFAGDIPEHDALTAIINTASDVCTSLLINTHLRGAFQAWAVVGTFGDNLATSACSLARSLDLTESQLQALQNLGIYLNYNGYGAALEDLYFDPEQLYRKVSQFSSPFDFIQQDRDSFDTLEQGYNDDMAKAAATKPVSEHQSTAVFRLPNAAWARRVSGVYGNDLANQTPQRAHAVVTERSDGSFVVSVRAPLNKKQGADEVCRQFDTGGGRAAAAGINSLPESELPRFIDTFSDYYATQR
ncbi:MAG: DHH family phosphoesterase [Gammaproteobacteria bacterium]|nr:DHH family phosphoesterase [Gammaproteobacteria bacterium]